MSFLNQKDIRKCRTVSRSAKNSQNKVDKLHRICYNENSTKGKAMSEFRLENTIGGQLLNKLNVAINEMVEVPNNLLPETFQDKVRGGRTLARLEEMCDKQEGLTEHRKLKNIRAENIEDYRKQFVANGKFEYDGHRDELQLYRNEQAFCNACPAIDIDEDDLLEG